MANCSPGAPIWDQELEAASSCLRMRPSTGLVLKTPAGPAKTWSVAGPITFQEPSRAVQRRTLRWSGETGRRGDFGLFLEHRHQHRQPLHELSRCGEVVLRPAERGLRPGRRRGRHLRLGLRHERATVQPPGPGQELAPAERVTDAVLDDDAEAPHRDHLGVGPVFAPGRLAAPEALGELPHRHARRHVPQQPGQLVGGLRTASRSPLRTSCLRHVCSPPMLSAGTANRTGLIMSITKRQSCPDSLPRPGRCRRRGFAAGPCRACPPR